MEIENWYGKNWEVLKEMYFDLIQNIEEMGLYRFINMPDYADFVYFVRVNSS